MSDVRSRTYVRPSAVTGTRTAPVLGLETSGGATPTGTARHPHFYSGVLTASQAAAVGLLAVADVSRTWYREEHPGRAVLDPVVTGHDDRLRFEALSPCRGLYARLDILGDGVNGARIHRGSAHFDVNDTLLHALGRVRSRRPLHLRVGPVLPAARAALDGPNVRKKVPSPQLPLRDFAEAQAVASRLGLRAEVPRLRAQRLVRALARQGDVRLWATTVNGGLGLSAVPSPSAVPLPDAGRLEVLQRVALHMTSLRLYGPPAAAGHAGAASAWEAVLPGMRLTLVPLSGVHASLTADGRTPTAPDAESDTHADTDVHTDTDTDTDPDAGSDSGSDACTDADADPEQGRQDAELLSVLLSWESRIDPAALAEQAGLTVARTRTALALLVDAGRCGYDAAEAAYFHRELPFHLREPEPRHPRLVDARALVEAGAVTLNRRSGTATVASSGTVHHIRELHGRRTCTCLWWSRHQGVRGPCEHGLAAVAALRNGPSRSRPAARRT
ncbi:SWIM zinc finger family protein [Streptomyces cadmiisoli]|uniref:SWIM zinc finger family protein n=1 Tax=Streptomyces cadmiisoli TaxID=2184053 RepID=A0A2Z4JD18_9ACTN|nr:SWIM zinc finger family protein [Streptomyces cadmiisoli]AWW43062.1 SWIM zinc finger family protein [Streptomyces cadmiisoli]